MEHRKDKHASTVAFCRNKREGNCVYSDEKCWWNHSEQPRNKEEPNKCYICEKTIENRGGLMLHKKVNHQAIVRRCSFYQNGACRFREESCWYRHKETVEEKEETENIDINEETPENSFFYKAKENMKPPLGGNQSQ